MKRTELPALRWRKSTRSTQENCVEVARTSDFVGVRDSKDPHGPVLVLSSSAFTSFLRTLR